MHHVAMAFEVERLLNLWTNPLPEGSAAEDAFRELYTDPVTVNGTSLSAAEMVTRARALQGTFEQPHREILGMTEGNGSVAVAFRLSGRQVGPLSTSVGVLPPTGQVIALRVIDILTIDDGLVSEIVMVADELGGLAAIGAAALTPPTG
jgi:hypothetical protein